MNSKIIIAMIICSMTWSLYAQNITRAYNIAYLEEFSQPKNPESTGFVEYVSASKLFKSDAKGAIFEVEELEGSHINQVIKNLIEDWQDGQSIELRKDMLYINQTRENHQKIADFLSLLQREMTRTIYIKIEIYQFPQAEFDNKLADLALVDLSKKIAENKPGNIATSVSFSTFNGRRAVVPNIQELSYIGDKDVEIAQASFMADPIVQKINEGIVYDLLPMIAPDGHIYVEGGVSLAQCEKPMRSFKGNVQLPALHMQGIMGSFRLKPGIPKILGLYSAGQQVHIVVAAADSESTTKPVSPWQAIDGRWLLHDSKDYNLTSFLPAQDRLKSDKSGVMIVEQEEKVDNIDSIQACLNYEKFYRCQDILVGVKSKQNKGESITQWMEREKSVHSLRLTSYRLDKKAWKTMRMKYFAGRKMEKGDVKWLVENSKNVRHLQTCGTRRQYATAFSLISRKYLKDYDVEIATGSAVLDPIIGSISEGNAIEARFLSRIGDKVLFQIYGIHDHLHSLLKTAVEKESDIECPQFEHSRISGQFLLTPGDDYLLGSHYHQDEILIFVGRAE